MEKTIRNVQICSIDKVDKQMMLSVFNAFILNHGFVPCEADESERSYLLSYAASDVCSWLTVSEEHWQNDLFLSSSDALELAQEFRMPVLRLTAADNGSAAVELIDRYAKTVDTCVTGDAVPDMYNNISLSKGVWQECLKPIVSLEQLLAVLKARYHSADEVMTVLAPLLHIGKEQLLMDAVSGKQGPESVRLYFKSVTEDIKKVTVKNTFKRIFGDALKPLGFVMSKTKQQLFIRVVNNELIHIIGIQDMKPNFIVPFGGVATLYREDLQINATYRQTSTWLLSPLQFWGKTHTALDEAPDPRLRSKFHYLLKSPDSVENTLQATLNAVQRWILPHLNAVRSLQDLPAYYDKCFGTLLSFIPLPLHSPGSGYSFGDAVVRYLLDDPVSSFEQYYAELVARHKIEIANYPNDFSPELIKINDDHLHNILETARQSVDSFMKNFDMRQQTIVELERRRETNLELLHMYGV